MTKYGHIPLSSHIETPLTTNTLHKLTADNTLPGLDMKGAIHRHIHTDTDSHTHHSPAHPTDLHSLLQFTPLLPTTTPTPAPLVMHVCSSVRASFYSNTQTVCKTKGLYPHKRDAKSGKSWCSNVYVLVCRGIIWAICLDERHLYSDWLI